MKVRTKKKLKQLSKKIIKSITEEILIFFKSWEPYGQFAQRMWGLPYRQRELSSKQLYQAVKKAYKRGWLEEKKVQDQIYYRLTKEGKIRQLIVQVKRRPYQRGERATIVIFDIPEAKRSFRNFLRRLLKQMDFTMIQKSVFIAPHMLPKEFYILLEEMNLLPYVMIIEGQIRFNSKVSGTSG